MASGPIANAQNQTAPATRAPRRQGPLFRFSLRALLLLVLVSAIACGWVTNRMAQKRREEAAIQAFGQKVYVSWNWEAVRTGPNSSVSRPSGPEWLRKILGQNFFNEIDGLSLHEVTDSDDLKELVRVQECPIFIHSRSSQLRGGCGNVPEATGPEISDAGLAYVAAVVDLKELTIGSKNITDAGLRHLCRLESTERN